MTASINININLRASDGAAKQVSATIRQLKTETNQVATAYDRAEAALKKADAGFIKADRDARALAQSEIRAAIAARDYGQALGIVDQELKSVTPGTVKYNSLLAQQATLTRQAEESTKSQGFSLLSVAKGYLGIQTAKQVVNWAKEGAAITDVATSFDSLATSIGTTSDVFLNQLRAASRGGITDAELMAKANEAVLLTQGRVAKDLPQLLNIARASAKATGQEVTKTFNDSIIAVGRSSARIADNLGFIVDTSEANDRHAKSIGKVSSALTEQEVKQAFLQEFLRQGNQLTQTLGNTAETSAEKIARAETALGNFGNKLKIIAGNSISFLQDAADTLNAIFDGSFAGAGAGNDSVVASAIGGPVQQSYEEYVAILRQMGQEQAAVSRNEYILAQALQASGTTSAESARLARELNLALGEVKTGGDATAATFEALNSRALEIARISPEAAQGVTTLVQAMAEGNIGAVELALQLELLALKAQLAKQEQYGAAEASYLNSEAMASAAGAAQANQVSLEALTGATYEDVLAKIEAQTQAANLAALQRELENANNTSSGSAIGAAGSALYLASKYHLQFDEVQRLILATNELKKAQTSGNGKIIGNTIGSAAAGGANKSGAEGVAQAKAEEAARRDLLTNEQKIAALRKDIAGGKLSELDRLKALKEIQDLQQRSNTAAQRGAKAGAKDAAKDAREVAQEAEREAKARFDLLSAEEQLAQLKHEIASGKLPESERLEKLKDVRDLEKKIADERIAAIDAAHSAEKARIDDRQARRKEDSEAAAARRVLASGSTSAAQKAAAQDRLDEIAIDRTIRADEIAKKDRAAGVVPASSGALAGLPGVPSSIGGGIDAPGVPRNILGLGQSGVGGGSAAAAGGPQQITIPITILLDGKAIAAQLQGSGQSLTAGGLRVALQLVTSAGVS